jgi:hypothetical protein
MWIDKLMQGVVRVQTPVGPRYVMPTFVQQVYLLWTFRHFLILPHAVLRKRQQRLIDHLCLEQRFASMLFADGMPVIGTVETSVAETGSSFFTTTGTSSLSTAH